MAKKNNQKFRRLIKFPLFALVIAAFILGLVLGLNYHRLTQTRGDYGKIFNVDKTTDTQNWLTYTSKKAGFSIQYPPEFKIIEIPATTTPIYIPIAFQISNNRLALNISQQVVTPFKADILDQIKVGNEYAIRYINFPKQNNDGSISVYVHHGGDYSFSLTSVTVVKNNSVVSDPLTENDFAIFNSVLSTVKFAE